MKIFVAGATGAIGRRLVPLLVATGHSVIGTTRHESRMQWIRAAGAEAVLLDALHAQATMEAIRVSNPDVIVHELTAIPANLNVRKFDQEFAATNRLRIEGTDNLLAAAYAVGCRRFIAQSYAGWPYARTGDWIKTEDDPLLPVSSPGVGESVKAIVHVESRTLRDEFVRGTVLRYGALYGPGTSIGEGGSLLEEVRHRRVPVVGTGAGVWSFLHVDDAASATLAAIEADKPGLYNIVDDEPAPVSEWLPYLADALGSKPPRQIPAWLGRLALGQHGVAMMTEARGASNRKAKSLLPWTLKWPTWREGFRDGLHETNSKPLMRSQEVYI